MPTSSSSGPLQPRPISDTLDFEVHDAERPITWNAYRGRQLMGHGSARTKLGAAIQMRALRRQVRREDVARRG